MAVGWRWATPRLGLGLGLGLAVRVRVRVREQPVLWWATSVRARVS